MTDDEIQVYLSLKFSSLGEVVRAFKRATGLPENREIPEGTLMKLIDEWVQQGAPAQFHVPPEKTESFLRIKFGTIEKAYQYWCTHRPNEFNKAEEAIMLDHIAKPKAEKDD